MLRWSLTSLPFRASVHCSYLIITTRSYFKHIKHNKQTNKNTYPSPGFLRFTKQAHHFRSACQICPPPARLVRSRAWMWRSRMIALNLTKITSQIKLIKPATVSRLLTSQANCCCMLSVHVTSIKPRYMSSQPKRLRRENMTAIKIGTHNGTFHCDEVLACFFLRQLPEYKVGPARCHGALFRDDRSLYCSLICCCVSTVCVVTTSV